MASLLDDDPDYDSFSPPIKAAIYSINKDLVDGMSVASHLQGNLILSLEINLLVLCSLVWLLRSLFFMLVFAQVIWVAL